MWKYCANNSKEDLILIIAVKLLNELWAVLELLVVLRQKSAHPNGSYYLYSQSDIETITDLFIDMFLTLDFSPMMNNVKNSVGI